MLPTKHCKILPEWKFICKDRDLPSHCMVHKDRRVYWSSSLTSETQGSLFCFIFCCRSLKFTLALAIFQTVPFQSMQSKSRMSQGSLTFLVPSEQYNMNQISYTSITNFNKCLCFVSTAFKVRSQWTSVPVWSQSEDPWTQITITLISWLQETLYWRQQRHFLIS